MTLDAERLWSLIPAIHRLRDAEQGGPLRALVEVLAREARLVAEDIEDLYDDWFIETCSDAAVPYLAELLGVAVPAPLGAEAGVGPRAFVANTLRYRRRKGTVPVLEQLAADVTGWPARAVEYFPTLAQSAHLEHLRRDHPAVADLRAGDLHELTEGAFDRSPRTLEVRSIAEQRGRHGIPHIGLWLWRLPAYRLERTEPRAVPGSPWAFELQAPGLDPALVNPGRSEPDILHVAEEEDVPARLRRLPLSRELAARRDGAVPATRWFDPDADPPFRLWTAAAGGDDLSPVPADRLRVCDLSVLPAAPDPAAPPSVAVDPVLGRIAVLAGPVPAVLRADFAYAAGGDLGAGHYDRRGRAALPERVGWQVGVARRPAPIGDERIVPSLAAALALWRDEGAGRSGLITILDNGVYDGDAAVALPPDSALWIAAAAWPALPVPDSVPARTARRAGVVDPIGLRPLLLGDVAVTEQGGAGERRLALDGLWIGGRMTVAAPGLVSLTLRHATLAPVGGGLAVDEGSAAEIAASRCILGPVAAPAADREHRFEDSILDGQGGAALDAPAAAVALERCTVLGTAAVREVEASGCLFMAPVAAERRQQGCIRFSWIAPGSGTPRRYRCQPDLATAGLAGAEADAAAMRAAPVLASTRFGDAAYGRLGPRCPPGIAAGGEHEAELGAFAFQENGRRLADLTAALRDYLRFGREAGFLDAT